MARRLGLLRTMHFENCILLVGFELGIDTQQNAWYTVHTDKLTSRHKACMTETQHRTTIRMARSLAKSARIKALQMDTNLSEVVRRFLEAWVSGRISLPKPEEERPEEE